MKCHKKRNKTKNANYCVVFDIILAISDSDYKSNQKVQCARSLDVKWFSFFAQMSFTFVELLEAFAFRQVQFT